MLFFLTRSFCQVSDSIHLLKPFAEDSSKYVIIPVNINSSNSDFCPVIINGKMLFVSGRENSFGVVFFNNTKRELLDLYISKQIDSVHFRSPKIFSKTINSHYNDGPACFNDDNNLMIFNSNGKVGSSTPKNLQLYSSVKKNNNWTDPALLIFCRPEFSYCHPFLSPDQKTLFFSSNISGGYGGMDLYYSHFENNSWTTPVNLGANINTSANEVFPFVSRDTVLYFSSDNVGGYGGLDIYSFDINDTTHSKKQLLEKPLNSSADDFGIYIDPAGNKGYLSSDRNKENSDDIFYFLNKQPSFKNCKPYSKPSNCFTFFEESTLQTEDTLGLVYEWDLGDGTKIKGVEAKHCYKKPGDYMIELNIIEKISGALFYNEASYEFAVRDSEQVNISSPDTIAFTNPAALDCERSVIPGSSIINYHWNFGDGNYSNDKAGLHSYKKEGVYMISLSLTAKNDSSGILSNFCAEKKLVVQPESWIRSEKTKYSQPQSTTEKVYSSKNVDSLNFRVYLGSSEKKIPLNSEIFNNLTDIKEYKKDSLYRYTSGSSKTISDILPTYDKAKTMGFQSAVVVGFTGETLLPKQERSLTGKVTRPIQQALNHESDKSIMMRNVFFEFNKYEIGEIYFSSLDSLSQLLKKGENYDLSLFSFADSTGNNNYNMQLSEKRASAVKKYFLNKGVKENRIKFIPMGEEIPLEENIDLTDNGYHRRVLIFLIKK